MIPADTFKEPQLRLTRFLHDEIKLTLLDPKESGAKLTLRTRSPFP